MNCGKTMVNIISSSVQKNLIFDYKG